MFKLDVFQHQVPIGGTLDFGTHFHNNTCETMTVFDTLYVYREGALKKTLTFGPWSIPCEADLDLCFALKVPENDHFICWDLTVVYQGVGVAGGQNFPFSEAFYVHIEPGHGSEAECE